MNHQYDKSVNFLILASEYVRTFLSPNLVLQSVLHDLWELEITRTFCEEPSLLPFHSLFLSCNEPVCDVRSAKYLENKKLEIEKNKEESFFLKKLHLEEKNLGTDQKNQKFLENKNKIENKANENKNYSSNKSELKKKNMKNLNEDQVIEKKKSCCEWCCECEKCAFIFLLFSAWLPPKGRKLPLNLFSFSLLLSLSLSVSLIYFFIIISAFILFFHLPLLFSSLLSSLHSYLHIILYHII